MLSRLLSKGAVVAMAALVAANAACGSSPTPAPAAPAPATPAAAAPAAAAPATPDPPALKDAPRESFTLASKVLAETRRINLYTPPGYAEAPAARFPVLYLLDGGDAEDFPTPHIFATVDAAIRAGEMRPMIVVGIENTERRRDLTGPTAVEADKAIAKRVGGSAAFRAFVRDELMPEIARRARITGAPAIMGESLAGLFVVETFFLEPALFGTYIAISPSTTWNDSALVRGAAAWLKAHPGLVATLYIAGAGDDELDGERTKLAQLLRDGAPRGLTWFYEPRSDRQHANIYETVAPGVLRRLFPPVATPPSPPSTPSRR